MIDVVWYGAEVTEKLQFLLISLHRHFSKKEFMQYPEPAPLCLCVLGFNTFALLAVVGLIFLLRLEENSPLPFVSPSWNNMNKLNHLASAQVAVWLD